MSRHVTSWHRDITSQTQTPSPGSSAWSGSRCHDDGPSRDLSDWVWWDSLCFIVPAHSAIYSCSGSRVCRAPGCNWTLWPPISEYRRDHDRHSSARPSSVSLQWSQWYQHQQWHRWSDRRQVSPVILTNCHSQRKHCVNITHCSQVVNLHERSLAEEVSSAWISNVCFSGLISQFMPGFWWHLNTLRCCDNVSTEDNTAITQSNTENQPGNSKMLVSSLHKVDIGLNATNWLVLDQCWMFLTPAPARPRSWWNSCLQHGVTPRYIGHCLPRADQSQVLTSVQISGNIFIYLANSLFFINMKTYVVKYIHELSWSETQFTGWESLMVATHLTPIFI